MAKSKRSTKTKYTDKELNAFAKLINEKLAQANEQLSFYKNQLKDFSENPDHKNGGPDDAIGNVELDRLNELAVRSQKYINHLENALLRIENKVYGICRVTGKLISKERLKAVPHATLSIAAKQDRI